MSVSGPREFAIATKEFIGGEGKDKGKVKGLKAVRVEWQGGKMTEVAGSEQVLPAAQELAVRLAAGPTAAYALVKRSVRFAASSTLAEALAEEERLQALAGRTQDHAAAVRSFLAKQPPVFEGR